MADQDSRAGARYASAQILDYAARTHHPDDRALRRAFEAPARHGMPEIQLGPAEGRLLELLLRLVGAKRVVEIGTLAGYSALWMARALPADGQLYTIEADPGHAGVAAEVAVRLLWQMPPQFAMFEQVGLYAETADGGIGFQPGFRGVLEVDNAALPTDVRVNSIGSRGPEPPPRRPGRQ